MNFHFNQELINIWLLKNVLDLVSDKLSPRNSTLSLHLLKFLDFSVNCFEAVADAIEKLLKVQSPQDKAVIVWLVKDLERSQSAEYILYNCQHLLCFRSAQAVAQLLPHLFDFFFVRGEGSIEGCGCRARLLVVLKGQDEVVEELL